MQKHAEYRNKHVKNTRKGLDGKKLKAYEHSIQGGYGFLQVPCLHYE
jgi:hypothetical protein